MNPWEQDWSAAQPPATGGGGASAPAAAPAPWEMDWSASKAAPVAKPQRSWGEFATGLARAAGQGISLNFGDEIEAFVRARVGSGDYEKELAKVRDEIDKFRDESPWTSALAEIAGGIVLPGLGAGKALAAGAKDAHALTAGNIAKSAAVSAGYGGAAGFGAGEGFEDRMQGAAIGTAVGGVVGATAPVVVEGVKTAKDAAGALMRRGGMGDVQKAGDRVILDSARKAAESQKTGLDTELARWEGAAKGQAPIYGAHDEVRKLGEQAVKMGGEAAETGRNFVDDAVAARANSKSLGIEDLATGQGYRAAKGDVVDDLTNAVKPEYDKLYRGGREAIPALDALIRDPKNGLKEAAVEALKEANEHAWKIDGAVEKLHARVAASSKKGGSKVKEIEWTPRQVDYLLRNLGERVGSASGDNREAARKMKEAVETAISGTRLGDEVLRVRGEFADNRTLNRALDFGRSFDIRESSRAFESNLVKFKGMSGTEREAAKIGIREKLMDFVSKNDGVEKSLKQLDNETTKKNLREIFGKEADAVIAQIERAAQNQGVEKKIGAAAQSAAEGRASIENISPINYMVDLAATTAMGVPAPVYGPWKFLRGLHALDRTSSAAVANGLMKLQANGTNMDKLYDRLRKMDKKQQQDFTKRLIRAGHLGQQTGAAAGEATSGE